MLHPLLGADDYEE